MRFSFFATFVCVIALGGTNCLLGQQPTLQELLMTIKEGKASESANAALSLGEQYDGSPVVVDALTAALSDTRDTDSYPLFVAGPRMTVATFAAEALQMVGEPAVPSLARLAESEMSPELRERAMDVLADMHHGAFDAIPSLELCLKDDANEIRLRAVHTLGLVQPNRRKLATVLEPMLADKSPHVRAAAIRALGDLGTIAADAVPSLIRMLDDTDERWHAYSPDAIGTRPVRFDAAEALGKIGAPARDAVEKLHAMMTNDQDDLVQVGAAFAYCRLAGNVRPGLDVLAKRVIEGGEWSDSSAEAAIALCELGTASLPTIPALTKALRHPNSLVRMYGAEAIANIDPANAAHKLLPLFLDENRMVRESAIVSLAKSKVATDDVIAAYVVALDDKNEVFSDGVRYAAAEALGQLGPQAKSAVVKLKVLKEKDENPWVKAAAKTALKRIESTQ